MVLHSIGRVDASATPLTLAELPRPVPGRGEILIEISVCGVCHTELDEIEGRTPPPHLPVVPGHEVVGMVADAGEGCGRYSPGDRVGVGWIHSSDGGAAENTSDAFRATGRDVNGGYAEFMTVPEAYAYPIPALYSDVEAAPNAAKTRVNDLDLRVVDPALKQYHGNRGLVNSWQSTPGGTKNDLDSVENVFINKPAQGIYAIWVTVGFFEIEFDPMTGDKQLGQEYGLDTGNVERNRAFYIFDRSIPVGFFPGRSLNVDRAVLVRSFIE